MSETESIERLVLNSQNQPVTFKTSDGRTFAAIPSGNGSYKLENITAQNAADVLMPKQVSQQVKLQTGNSLVDYVNRFKNEDTALFADIDGNAVLAIIDYHTAANQKPDTDGVIPPTVDPSARLGVHTARLDLPFSLEWKTWTKLSDKLMSHAAFASFLEENDVDIVNPPGADLLELCRSLQVINNSSFTSDVRHGDYAEISYEKINNAASKGSVEIPAFIMLSIPVYFGQARVSVKAFLRRKIDDGHLSLGFVLSRAEEARQMEFVRIVDAIEELTEVHTVYGAPR